MWLRTPTEDAETGNAARLEVWLCERCPKVPRYEARLAGLFAIEVCGYSVMSNHLHLVLRNRPDIAEQWSADEIALRWSRILPPRHDATGEPVQPNEHGQAMLASTSERLVELRERLVLETSERPDAWVCELT
jgi:hypothetical protein